MNLVESRTGGGDESGGNWTGGGYMLQVVSDWRDGYVVVNMAAVVVCGYGLVVVYGYGLVMVYGDGLVADKRWW